MSQIDKYRRIVDDIDSQVVALIERRLEIARRIGEEKINEGLPARNLDREQLIMEQNAERLRDKSFTPQIHELYQLILKQNYDLQKSIVESNSN